MLLPVRRCTQKGVVLQRPCSAHSTTPPWLPECNNQRNRPQTQVLHGGYDPIHTRYSLDLRKLVDTMLQRDPAKVS